MKSAARSLLILAASLALAPFARADIKARGSDSTLHVLKALASAFEAETGKKVALEGGGSGAGVKGLSTGEVSLAFLSRELKAEEKSAGLGAKGQAIVVKSGLVSVK